MLTNYCLLNQFTEDESLLINLFYQASNGIHWDAGGWKTLPARYSEAMDYIRSIINE